MKIVDEVKIISRLGLSFDDTWEEAGVKFLAEIHRLDGELAREQEAHCSECGAASRDYNNEAPLWAQRAEALTEDRR